MTNIESDESKLEKLDCESLLQAIDICKAHFTGREDQTRLTKAQGAVYIMSMKLDKGQRVDERGFLKELSLVFDTKKYSEYLREQNSELWGKLKQMDIVFGMDAMDDLSNRYFEEDERSL